MSVNRLGQIIANMLRLWRLVRFPGRCVRCFRNYRKAGLSVAMSCKALWALLDFLPPSVIVATWVDD